MLFIHSREKTFMESFLLIMEALKVLCKYQSELRTNNTEYDGHKIKLLAHYYKAGKW